jgi:large subunit ribosomal protein L4
MFRPWKRKRPAQSIWPITFSGWSRAPIFFTAWFSGSWRGDKKVYKQKGTGGARHGSRRPGIFVGGGKAFGPVVRSHAIDLPKRIRALALKHALSSKAKASEIIVIDKTELKDAKTKALKAQFEKLGLKNALIIDGAEVNKNFVLAARSLIDIDVLPVQGINVYDILRRRQLVLTKAAVEALEVRFN